jgi:uracil-DNA glycosylase
MTPEALAKKPSENRFPNNLPEAWRNLLQGEEKKEYFKTLTRFLNSEYKARKSIFPKRENILRALQEVDYNDVKVVILGQDPYHGNNQAIGLSFAVPNDLSPKPPSLLNIYKEIKDDLKIELDTKASDLSGWTQQGVLLLNSVLTVEAHKAFSHRDKGWETLTDKIIELLNKREKPIVFILWGSAAQKKAALVDRKKHFILKSPHPSPLSSYRGFFGCHHFSKTNEILKNKIHTQPINWQRTVV